MIGVRIVCTYDAVKFAENLMRLLDAEQHAVRLSYGRQSLVALEEERVTPSGAVLLVWSFDAPTQHYMLEWAQSVAPDRLVEIGRARGAPRLERHAPVIDFTQWRGERGGRAWIALSERLRTVERVLHPPKGPPQPALAVMSLAAIAAVSGAFVVRMNAPEARPDTAEAPQLEEVALGGAIETVEPASVEDLWIEPIERVRYAPLELIATPDLLANPVVEIADLRDPTLIERLASLNPLRIIAQND